MSVGAEALVEQEASAFDIHIGHEITARSPLQLFWRRFRSDKVAMVSLAFIVLLIIVAFAAPLVVKVFGVSGPNVQNVGRAGRVRAADRAELGCTRSASTSSAATSSRA